MIGFSFFFYPSSVSNRKLQCIMCVSGNKNERCVLTGALLRTRCSYGRSRKVYLGKYCENFFLLFNIISFRYPKNVRLYVYTYIYIYINVDQIIKIKIAKKSFFTNSKHWKNESLKFEELGTAFFVSGKVNIAVRQCGKVKIESIGYFRSGIIWYIRYLT
jgi:hypothetical protein